MSFDEEFLGLLKKHAVDFDPKFVFGRPRSAAPTALGSWLGCVPSAYALG
jgi:hypothetical protein